MKESNQLSKAASDLLHSITEVLMINRLCEWLNNKLTKRDFHMSDCATNNAPALPVGTCDCGLVKLHWSIRLRKKLLIAGTWKWNAWVRDFTGYLEMKFK